LVLALVLPLALSSALPIYARIVGGPMPHVCHCAAHGGHSMCACPVCNPDREDLQLGELSLRGKCGDDDVSFGAALGSALIAPATGTVLAADLVGEAAPAATPTLPPVFLAPPTPPPRSA
jgi:hypothetical protein